MGGKAVVAYLNLNAISPLLAPRTNAALKTLGAAPGITVINISVSPADFNPRAVPANQFTAAGAPRCERDPQRGYRHPRRRKGGAGPRQHKRQIHLRCRRNNPRTGRDKGGGLIKATFGFAWPLIGYATGQFAADWLDGKSIPQAIVVNAVPLDSVATINRFQKINASLQHNWQSQPQYLTFLGKISYESRQRWLRNALAGGPA